MRYGTRVLLRNALNAVASAPQRPARRRDLRGAVAVEFALVVIPLLTLLLGCMQYGYFFYVKQSTSAATHEAARRISVGDCPAGVGLSDYVEAQLPPNVLTSAAVAPTTYVVGDSVEITVVTEGGIIHFVPMPNGGTVTEQATVRVEDMTPSPSGCT